jgi:uncharacterized protein (TIRG00374 family)
LLSFLNYILRFFKWEFYLSVLDIKLNRKDSLISFFSGFVMSITPGKFGEVLKSYLVKQINGTSISKSAPIVAAERLTDFIALIVLSFAGVLTYSYGLQAIIVITIFLLTLIGIISSRKISLFFIGIFERLPVFSKIAHKIHNAYQSIYQLLSLKNLFIATLISVFSWFFECLGLYFIFKGFNLENSLFGAIFIYSFSTIIGAVSMMPGGLGVTEGSLTGLLIKVAVPKALAVSTTFIIRVCTLWFGVLIGAVVLFMNHKRFYIEFSKSLDLENSN